MDHFLEVVIITQSVVECPHVTSIKLDVRITTGAVRMMTMVEAGLMPAEVDKWTVAIRHKPIRCRICYDMQQCCNNAYQARGEC